ncbi:hypothetical protein [Mesobacillus foraminis]|nr:hypothetical protein [Mesobacillus foraminis]
MSRAVEEDFIGIMKRRAAEDVHHRGHEGQNSLRELWKRTSSGL